MTKPQAQTIATKIRLRFEEHIQNGDAILGPQSPYNAESAKWSLKKEGPPHKAWVVVCRLGQKGRQVYFTITLQNEGLEDPEIKPLTVANWIEVNLMLVFMALRDEIIRKGQKACSKT